MPEEEPRTLTDADVNAITDSLREKVVTAFYRDLGRGVWGWIWRATVMAMIALAAYGASRSIH